MDPYNKRLVTCYHGIPLGGVGYGLTLDPRALSMVEFQNVLFCLTVSNWLTLNQSSVQEALEEALEASSNDFNYSPEYVKMLQF